MLVGLDKLSKETRSAIEEFVEDIEDAGAKVDLKITRDAGDHLWGVTLSYIDDEGRVISEETYMTARGHSEYVAQFIVFYQDDGKHVDFSTWSPMAIVADDDEGKFHTLSAFVLAVLIQLTPHPFTAEILGIDDSCSCDDGDDDESVDHQEVEDDDKAEP